MLFKRVLLFVGALLLIAAAGCCHGKAECRVKESGTNFAYQALGPFLKSGELPGFISVFYNNGIQETARVGWANIEKKIPIAMDQPYMTCSQSKGVCGVAMAILVEDGKISLDDPVSKYLPEFKNLKIRIRKKNKKSVIVPAKNVLTVRMVMNHTGGFGFETPYKSKHGWNRMSLRETAKLAASLPLRFEPGTKASYSNTGIDIGAAVIEVVSGKDFETFLRERLFGPLGMNNSTFNPTDKQLANYISLYKTVPGKKAEYMESYKWLPRPYNGPSVHPSAGAGLWTTASDQLKFYKMLMNLGIGDNGVRVLKEETVKKLLVTSTRPAGMAGYSLGLHIGKNGWFGHGGAYGTNCMVNWQKKQLRMCAVQCFSNGREPVWTTDWEKSAEKFFASDMEGSSVREYTGRTK